MRNWKHWTLVAVLLLVGGAFYVNAQDMIVLKDGDMIEAKVLEISPSEIRYKRFDHLGGPTIVIPAANVLSIRYENGTYEIINAGVIPQQGNAKAEQPGNAAINPDKFIFGINANAGGALGYLWEGPSGFGINIELGKGKFNSEINLMFPTGGFGALFAFNGFWPSKIGGFYLGGGIGWSTYHNWGGDLISLPVGLNIGYKFVTKSGLYFRTGAFAAFDLGYTFGSRSEEHTSELQSR
jgi:hypothetical protein